MPTLEVFDAVVLKANRKLVGIVDRVHYESNEPLRDILIIAHVLVDPDALEEFVRTGSPPKNYVFVRFADESQGSSLVHETDVILLDRSFSLGDVVKKEEGHMLGTVISVNEQYDLQPLWVSTSLHDETYAVIPFDEVHHTVLHVCSSDCPFGALSEIDHPSQTYLLRNIPAEELEMVEDVVEGDYVLQDDFLGVVEVIEQIVIVLLEDGSVVVVKECDELYIPVEDEGKPLVSLPEFDELARPDALVALQGWSATIPPTNFRCGQLVITNHRNLKMGRWLRGQFDSTVKPQGRVLDVRSKSMEVKWLAPNAFIPETPFSVEQPSARTSLYDNINTFPRRSELRSNKSISIYDHSRFPRITEDRVRYRGTQALIHPLVRSSTDFRVGDDVKFRDQAGAGLKYLGTASRGGELHGKFDRIPSWKMHGFDINKFKIVYSQQEATVIWHDGSTSKHLSKTLAKFTLFEPELAPADLVVSRDGLKQIQETSSNVDYTSQNLIDFNEMKFFETPHCLLPNRVGVVQEVNQTQRFAKVRWFETPKICIGSYGHVLSADSRFGKLSDFAEEVSLYEIMTFPVLMRHLKDLVMIAPDAVSSRAIDTIQKSLRPPREDSVSGLASISQINPYGEYDLLCWLQFIGSAVAKDSTPLPIIESSSYKLHPANGWFGEIVSLGLDGLVTVRVSTRGVCKDVRLEHDQLVCFIDDGAIENGSWNLVADQASAYADMSIDGSDDFDTMSTISETVEYEGGERLDNDSGDENWEDAHDEEEMEVDQELTNETVHEEANTNASTRTATPTITAAKPAQKDQSRLRESTSTIEEVVANAGEASSSSQWPEHTYPLSLMKVNSLTPEPPPFLIMERPPPDQYEASELKPPAAAAFLKRIVREHAMLSSSLPRGEIYVRTYENRLDLMRCLIIGPADTPYEHAPFLIDLQLGKNYPREPPVAHFHSWTSGLGRINPNLYEEGKICLSLLGTWPGRGETEGWTENATILQLLVSLQGLVLVRQPFYNEAGFEEYTDDGAYKIEAQRYNEKAYVMARAFVKHVMNTPINGLEDVLAWIYLPRNGQGGLLHTVISRSNSLIQRSESDTSRDLLVDGDGSTEDDTKVFLKPLSRGAIVMLRKTLRSLESLVQPDAEDAMLVDVGEQ